MKHEMTLRATVGLMSLWGLLACGSAPEAATAVAANGKPDGAQLYDMYCTLCHGGDGKLGINGAKDLTASLLSREEMIAVVTHGRNTMAPFKQVLDPVQVEAVVDHLRALPK